MSFLHSTSRTARIARALVLLLGLILPQVVLYGPSLTGSKILLPLDFLQARRIYLPPPAGTMEPRPEAQRLSDLVLVTEMARRYAVEAVRGGRLPLWNPLNYCGAPFLAANHTAVFSPLRVLDYLWPSPVTIAWSQLVKSVLAGLGAYLFFRRALHARFLSAAIGAWSFPLVGWMIFWAGFGLSAVAAWLPWLLLAVDRTVRRSDRWGGLGGPCVALVTALMLVSGHAANAGHVLFASGLYALWLVVELRGFRGLFALAGVKSLLPVVCGWSLGVLASAPQTLPTLEYLQSSSRIAARGAGEVETPPDGLPALPQIVLPYFRGADHRDTVYEAHGNRYESAAAANAGLLAALFLAPLAFTTRRARSRNVFWIVLGALGVSQVLGIPLVEQLFHVPPLDLLRNNRFTLVTAWAALALSVAGLDTLARGEVRWRWWFGAFVALIAVLGAMSLYRMEHPPDTVVEAAHALRTGARASAPPLDTAAGIERAEAWLRGAHGAGAALCLLAVGLWIALGTRVARRAWFGPATGLLLVAELVANAMNVYPQCDPALYYPKLSVLDDLAARPPGRVSGAQCFQPNLNQLYGFRDVRGYDAADPAEICELVNLFHEPTFHASPSYARTLSFGPTPRAPLGDALNLRYVIVRGPQTAGFPPLLTGPDYWIWENPAVLPRVYVPRQVDVAPDKAERMKRLADKRFDPRAVVLTEVSVAGVAERAEGSGTLVVDEPERVVIELDMRTEGLAVLADAWEKNWTARLDGALVPILRVNHALRGVVAPAGRHTVEYRYEPMSFRAGLWIAACALMVLAGWAVVARRSTHVGVRA